MDSIRNHLKDTLDVELDKSTISYNLKKRHGYTLKVSGSINPKTEELVNTTH